MGCEDQIQNLQNQLDNYAAAYAALEQQSLLQYARSYLDSLYTGEVKSRRKSRRKSSKSRRKSRRKSSKSRRKSSKSSMSSRKCRSKRSGRFTKCR